MLKKFFSCLLGVCTLLGAFAFASCKEEEKQETPPASFYFLLKDGAGKEYKLKHIKGEEQSLFVYEELIEYTTAETELSFTLEGPFHLSDNTLVSDSFYEIQWNDFVEFTVDASHTDTYPAEISIDIYDYTKAGGLTYVYTVQFYVEIAVTVVELEGIPDDVPSEEEGDLTQNP